MARPMRIKFENAFYHVTNRGINKQPIFLDADDRIKFLEILRNMKRKYKIIVYAYILMTNHFHIFMKTLKPNLSAAMQYLLGTYARYFNEKYKRKGHLFQNRYLAILVDNESYLLELCRYIELNALRAGIVQNIEDYKWSSFAEIVGANDFGIVNAEFILSHFGADRKTAVKRYKDFLYEGQGIKWEKFRKKIYAKGILGSKKFTKKAKKQVEEARLTYSVSDKRKLVKRQSKKQISRIIGKYCERKNIEDQSEIIDIKIYFLCAETDMTLAQIGEFLGGLSYGAVNMRRRRFVDKMRREKCLNELVSEIGQKIEKMFNVQA